MVFDVQTRIGIVIECAAGNGERSTVVSERRPRAAVLNVVCRNVCESDVRTVADAQTRCTAGVGRRNVLKSDLVRVSYRNAFINRELGENQINRIVNAEEPINDGASGSCSLNGQIGKTADQDILTERPTVNPNGSMSASQHGIADRSGNARSAQSTTGIPAQNAIGTKLRIRHRFGIQAGYRQRLGFRDLR